MSLPLHFLWPQLLWLLWAIPLLLLAYVWLLRSKRQPALRYASLATVRLALQPGLAWRRHLPPALLLAATLVLLLAAARPLAVLPLPTHQATVVLAVDVSLSMQADDIAPSRLDAAREAAKRFVRHLPAGVRVGIVSFAGTAHVVQPPTRSRDDLLAAVDRLHLQHGTAIGNGIVMALSELFPDAAIDLGETRYDALRPSRLPSQARPALAHVSPVPPGSDRSAAIVLLTDGRSTYGMTPLDAADMAAQRGVRIHAVGLGQAEAQRGNSEDWSAVMQLDEEALKAVTARTRGDYFHADSADALMQVYQKLGARIQVEARPTELTGPLALGAMLLLGCAAVLSLLWFQRVA